MAQLAYSQMKTDMQLQQLSKEMKDFKDEMKNFKNEMNKRWGELANKMGTIVADLIYPNLPTLLQETFSLPEPLGIGMNIRRKDKKTGIQGEIDVLVEFDEIVFINETKSTLRLSHLEEFDQFIKERFPILFKEYLDKKIIPIMSSLKIEEALILELTAKKMFGVMVFGNILTFKNLEDIRKVYGL